MNAGEEALPESERVHPGSGAIEGLEADAILELFEGEDSATAAAVAAARPAILELGRRMARALEGGGRIIYVGAGTSGRLGVLDAAEWGPTFGVDPERVRGLIAGGPAALSQAIEGAEDRADLARRELAALSPAPPDLVVGISASGAAASVLASLELARARGAQRALITTRREALPGDPGLLRVVLETGPEVVAGSTRLKAAAATHLVLQRASSLCGILLGWIHHGLMVEMRPTNEKLRRRARRIVAELAQVPEGEAATLLDESGGDIKVAIVSGRLGIDREEARRRLQAAGRRLTAFPELG